MPSETSQETSLEQRSRRVVVPNHPAYVGRVRDFVEEFLQQAGISADVTSEILLAVDEAAANACRHGIHPGDPGDMRVECRLDGYDVIVRVTDRGPGFDPASVDLSKAMDPWSGGGRGLFLMRQFMDDVDVQSSESGTTVTLVRRPRRRKADRYLGQLLNYAPIGVVTLDVDGVVVGWNPKAAEIIGIAPRDAVGAGFMGVFGDESQLRELLSASHRIAIEPPRRVFERRVEDHAQFVEVTACFLPGKEGAETYMLLMQDVTDRVVAEQDRRAVLHQLFHSNDRYANLARTLQQSLLPPELPNVDGIDVASFYRPAVESEIGGDFYDAFQTAEGEWAIVMGDVCGKGPHAAAITAQARYTIRTATMWIKGPRGILSVANEAILRQTTDEVFCTAAYIRLVLSPEGPWVSVATAGHPSPLLVRANGDVQSLSEPGLPLGLFPGESVREQRASLRPGDVLVVFTDGVLDAGAPAHAFGEAGLRALLAECSDCSGQEIVERLERQVIEFEAEGARDDCAALVLKVRDHSS